jgi:hypothetical protein
MMRVKITPMGGYVVGDGPCPFDPEEFMLLFGNKVLDAQRQGMEMLEIPDAEIDMAIAAAKVQWRTTLANATLHVIPDDTPLEGVLSVEDAPAQLPPPEEEEEEIW